MTKSSDKIECHHVYVLEDVYIYCISASLYANGNFQ
jgi:hypothetical protein